MIPIGTDYRMTRTPWANYALVGANVVVFLMGYHAWTDASAMRISAYMLHPDNPKLVQFFSCMFLHGSLQHLLGNMVFLWVFGNAINDKFGQAGYLAFYLAGGVLAGVGYILLGGTAPVVGASGAISAVTGAYLVLLPRTRVTVLMLLLYIFMPFEISSLYFLMFQFIWNVLMTTLGWAGAYSGRGGVAWAAHSAGYIFGIGVAAALLATKILPRDAYDLLNLIRSRHRRTRYRKMVREGYDPFNWVGSNIRNDRGRWVSSRSVDQAVADTPAARELALRRQISEALAKGDLPEAAKRYLELVQVAEDPVLARQQQLDIANHLMAAEQHAAAADAYERFRAHYADYQHIADIYLMLGLLYGRYLHQYDRAEQYLQQAIDGLHDQRKLDLARADLANVRRARR